MARVTRVEGIEGKIRIAEEKARKLKSSYDLALRELKMLQDKRKELLAAELIAAIDKSGKTVEEVIRLIKL